MIHCQIHRIKDTFNVFTSDGRKASEYVLMLKECLNFRFDTFVLDVYVDHDNQKCIINDILYVNQRDIHNMPYESRLQILKDLGIKQHSVFTISEKTLCKTEEELREAISEYSQHSDGICIKLVNMPYSLSGRSNHMVVVNHSSDELFTTTKYSGSTGEVIEYVYSESNKTTPIMSIQKFTEIIHSLNIEDENAITRRLLTTSWFCNESSQYVINLVKSALHNKTKG